MVIHFLIDDEFHEDGETDEIENTVNRLGDGNHLDDYGVPQPLTNKHQYQIHGDGDNEERQGTRSALLALDEIEFLGGLWVAKLFVVCEHGLCDEAFNDFLETHWTSRCEYLYTTTNTFI